MRLCRIFGHSYIAVETQNWGKYYFGDGSGPKFLGSQVIKLWCQRCGHRIDDLKTVLAPTSSNKKGEL